MTENRIDLLSMRNGACTGLAEVPLLSPEEFRSAVLAAVDRGARISSLFSIPARPAEGGGHRSIGVYVVLADDREGVLHVGRTTIDGDGYPALTPDCPQAHLFEREIAEQSGLKIPGHPWMKPVRYHRSWTGRDAWDRPPEREILPAVGDFYRLQGEQVHEVAVGPVHAGVIEPGHFRFQCHGETVYHLEIALGYQHRGVERALEGGPNVRSVHYAETAAGDSTVAHTTAYSQVIEALGGSRPSARASAVRGIALELERLANHVGDLGALSGDVGFLPTAAYCGRIRGDILNMTALLCGNRFGRSLVRPGGVAFDLDRDRADELLRRLDEAEAATDSAIDLLWNTPSVMARFEDTGPLPSDVAVELGVVGVAARASGLARDVRATHPTDIYGFSPIPVATCTSNDVLSRAYVRRLEIRHSFDFIRALAKTLPEGGIRISPRPPAPDSLAACLTEGWRGEVCHVAVTDKGGRFSRYKITDPSFHNWPALAHALRGQEISDFPLCNKSFNLSYCGHDL